MFETENFMELINMTKETQTTNTATVSTARKTESQNLEEVERQQEVGLEDIRRLMRDAYQQGFMDAVAWMQRPESELQ
ncbi:MAG: hypothetical protein ACOYNN_15300 [Terrimicrobiaceae bacterium]